MTKLITLRMGNIPITCIYDQPVDILPLDLVYPFLTKDEKGKIEITVHRRDNIARITTKVAASSPSWTMEKRQNCYLFDIYEKELLVANVIVNNSFSKSTVFINSVLERTKFLPLFVFYPILSGYFALNGIGFFFHGAAVQSNSVTLLLTGETGAGKSTLSNILGHLGYRKIADDKMLMAQTIHGETMCYSTPFDYKANKSEYNCAEVSAIIFLKHSDNEKNELKRIENSQCIMHLMLLNNIPFFDTYVFSKHCEIFNKTLRNIPMYQYSFVPNDTAEKPLRQFLHNEKVISK